MISHLFIVSSAVQIYEIYEIYEYIFIYSLDHQLPYTLYRSLLLSSLVFFLSRSDKQLIQRIPAGLSSTVACLDITKKKNGKVTSTESQVR